MKKEFDTPRLLTVREAAALLQVSERTLLSLIWRNQMPAVRISHDQWRINENELNKFIRRLFTSPACKHLQQKWPELDERK